MGHAPHDSAQEAAHADASRANASGLAAHAAGSSECRWSLVVNNTMRERTQLDLSVHGNDWSVLAPERSRVLAPGAHWVFEVVEQLPLARTKTEDDFELWGCSRLDGSTCAKVKLSCSRDQTLQHFVVDEHGSAV